MKPINMTLSRLILNKFIIPISLIILIASSAIAQETKVTLLSPVDGATGVHDPFTGNWEECLENGDCWWPIASDNPQARAIVRWNADYHPSGMYFVKMIAGDYINTQKLMLVK